MTKIKGPLFPSFKDPPFPTGHFVNVTARPEPQRSLPAGKSWIHHDGKQARLRRLRQMCGNIVHSTDPDIMAALQRVREISRDNEAGFLFVVSKAKSVADSNDLSIAIALNYMVDHIHDNDEKAEEKNEV